MPNPLEILGALIAEATRRDGETPNGIYVIVERGKTPTAPVAPQSTPSETPTPAPPKSK